MTNHSLNALKERLKDVEEVIQAHEALTGGGRGQPRAGQGRALTRAGIVLLSAAVEAFVEDLFEEAANKLYVAMTDDDKKFLIQHTAKQFNNPNCFKIEVLYLNLGLIRCLEGISWQKFANSKLRKEFNNLVDTRGSIAHGRGGGKRLAVLKRWKTMIENFAPRFVVKVAKHIEDATGTNPNW